MKYIALLSMLTSVLTAGTVSYQYSAAGRLVSATYPDGTTVAYTYDNAGNLAGRALATGGPQILPGGVVDAAAFAKNIVRGELVAIFGTGLAAAQKQAADLPLPFILGGVQVTMGGFPAAMFYVSPTQLVVQAPFELPSQGTASVVITRDGVPGNSQPVTLSANALAVFGYSRTATVYDPIIVKAGDNTLITPSNPAGAGDVLTIYATGIGTLDNQPATAAGAPLSPLASAPALPTATVGGAPVQVLFAGLTPGLVGLAQINIVLPSPLPGGSTLPLVIQFGSDPAASVTLYVH